jgi:hypothetical protein
MSKKCIDFIGQEVNIGDWAVVTQNNSLHVGKVIKAGNSVTIAVDSIDEFIKTDKSFINTSGWKNRRDFIKKKFGINRYYPMNPSWARDGKFIKITPTEEMMVDYDK